MAQFVSGVPDSRSPGIQQISWRVGRHDGWGSPFAPPDLHSWRVRINTHQRLRLP